MNRTIKNIGFLCLVYTLCVACNNIVDYNDNYTADSDVPNEGAPVISAVYDVSDTKFETPITEGNINQMVTIVGKNLNHVVSVKFNTVECDMANVYTASTKAVVQIPSKLSMENENKIEYTTDQGTAEYAFVIPFPDIICHTGADMLRQ